MSLQARMSAGDERLYNPSRDVAHNFKEVVTEVADRLEGERWPELVAILKREGVTMDELGLAAQAYCKFAAGAAGFDGKASDTMEEVLRNSGWFEVSGPAQVAYMAVLGTVMSGYFFAGIREARLGGPEPVLRLQDLADRGRECSQLMQMPRWRRKLYRLWQAAKKVVRSVRG